MIVLGEFQVTKAQTVPSNTRQPSSSDEDDGSLPSVMSIGISDSSMDETLSAASSLSPNSGEEGALIDSKAAMELSLAMAEPGSNISRDLDERAGQVDLDVAAGPSLTTLEPDSVASSALEQQKAASNDLETVKRLHRLLSAVPADLKGGDGASQVWSTGRACPQKQPAMLGHIKELVLDLYHAGAWLT